MIERSTKVDREIADHVPVNPKKGLVIESLGQAMEFSKMMAKSDKAVPPFLRENAGACLAIAIQGYEWGINPFALANKSYCVNDRLAYESALYHAVVQRRAPIRGRIKHSYDGEGNSRTCKVWALLNDGSEEKVEYESPKFGTIQPKNSPLWKNDPDQQLFYLAVRAFARRNFPDVMMGIYTVDELMDAPNLVEPEAPRGAAGLVKKLTQRPVSAGQVLADPETGSAENEPGAEQRGYVADDGDPQTAPLADTKEPDVSGAAAAAAEPPTDTAMSPREQFFAHVFDLCESTGISDAPKINSAVWTWAIACHPPVKGKEHKATAEQKEALFASIREKRGVFSFAG